MHTVDILNPGKKNAVFFIAQNYERSKMLDRNKNFYFQLSVVTQTLQYVSRPKYTTNKNSLCLAGKGKILKSARSASFQNSIKHRSLPF